MTKALNRAMGQGVAGGFANTAEHQYIPEVSGPRLTDGGRSHMLIESGSLEANFLSEVQKRKREIGAKFGDDALLLGFSNWAPSKGFNFRWTSTLVGRAIASTR